MAVWWNLLMRNINELHQLCEKLVVPANLTKVYKHLHVKKTYFYFFYNEETSCSVIKAVGHFQSQYYSQDERKGVKPKENVLSRVNQELFAKQVLTS